MFSDFNFADCLLDLFHLNILSDNLIEHVMWKKNMKPIKRHSKLYLLEICSLT